MGLPKNKKQFGPKRNDKLSVKPSQKKVMTSSEKSKPLILPKLLPSVRKSSDRPAKNSAWINKERLLILCSRGVSFLGRYLMQDLLKMMPHSKKDTKLDAKKNLELINELAEINNTNKVLFFEARKRKDLYLWLSCSPNGPSVKFLVENIRTTSELKLTGNALRSSRPVLCFDASFGNPNANKSDSETIEPHMRLIKELLIQTFGTPNQHPKSQPFIDKAFTFSLVGGRIWFRCYQIVEESGALAEIGPRFSLNPITIFDGSFNGSVMYKNPNYVSPNLIRRNILLQQQGKYASRVVNKTKSKERKLERKSIYAYDKTDDIFS